MQATILQISYAFCALAFLLLSALIIGARRSTPYAKALFVSAVVSVVWSLTVIFDARGALPFSAFILSLTELVRMASWIAFLALLVGVAQRANGIVKRSTLFLLVGGLSSLALFTLICRAISPPLISAGTEVLLLAITFMGLSVVGLLLLENLFRNSDLDSLWGVKFLCFGLGIVFAYDFFYYADTVLFRGLNLTLYEARGFVNTLAVPVIAVGVSRSHSWTIDIHVSRKIVFHSAALFACGFYLLLMAAAGYYVRELGGGYGGVLQIFFLVGSLILLISVFSSGSIRSRAKIFIIRNFYSSKYDYRVEWLRFIQALSSNSEHKSLQDRIIHALAQVVDSRGAALWVLNSSEGAYEVAAKWNFGDELPSEPARSSLVEILQTQSDLLEISKFKPSSDQSAASPVLMWLLGSERGRFILPLLHRGGVQAFIVLGQTRAAFDIGWSDRELLLTLGRQAASYLAEEEASNALLEARRWEEMNKRFAFVAHDIKNVVSQLSLLVKNAKAHGANPEFQTDMVVTVASSVDRMKQLLLQLRSKATLPAPNISNIDLTRCLERIGESWRKNSKMIEIELDPVSVHVEGDESRFVSAIGHLIQNAMDAAGENGKISLRSQVNERSVKVEVVDNGPGMDDEFVRNKLFQPLNSSKETGFGMGVYQVREYVRDMGGELNVDTAPGKGTKMQITLPIQQQPALQKKAIEPITS